MRSICGDRLHHLREALAPVLPYPPPVSALFTAPADRPPCTSPEGEVQHHYRVSGPKPRIQGRVAGPEVAVQDPGIALDQFPLPSRPRARICRDRAGLPEQRVQLDHGQAGHPAHTPGEGRLAGPATTEDAPCLAAPGPAPIITCGSGAPQISLTERYCGRRPGRWPAPRPPGSSGRTHWTEGQLAEDARERGWEREADRPQRTADRICGLIAELGEPSGIPSVRIYRARPGAAFPVRAHRRCPAGHLALPPSA